MDELFLKNLFNKFVDETILSLFFLSLLHRNIHRQAISGVNPKVCIKFDPDHLTFFGR